MPNVLRIITKDDVSSAIWKNKSYPAVIGKNGLISSSQKTEGDQKTPIGCFAIRSLWFRPDRIKKPSALIPTAEITAEDGWCDDPTHAQYNQHVTLPFNGSTESLMRDDGAYDLIITISHNEPPVVESAGSAIFIHAMHDDGRPTAGCIAMQRDDLMSITNELDAQSLIRIYPENH